MCGRFARTSSRDALVAEFGVARFINIDLAPRYNIAPSLYVETIVNDGTELRMGPMRWGFTTSAEKDAKPAPINARAETVATMALFREAFQRRRCLVVADGFYEWRKNGSTKEALLHPSAVGPPVQLRGYLVSVPHPGRAARRDVRDTDLCAQRPDGTDPQPDAGDLAARRA